MFHDFTLFVKQLQWIKIYFLSVIVLFLGFFVDTKIAHMTTVFSFVLFIIFAVKNIIFDITISINNKTQNKKLKYNFLSTMPSIICGIFLYKIFQFIYYDFIFGNLVFSFTIFICIIIFYIVFIFISFSDFKKNN